MLETPCTLFPQEFNRSTRVRSAPPERLTADAGALTLREVGERFGLWRLVARALTDPRDPELPALPTPAWPGHLNRRLLQSRIWPRWRASSGFRPGDGLRESDSVLHPLRGPAITTISTPRIH